MLVWVSIQGSRCSAERGCFGIGGSLTEMAIPKVTAEDVEELSVRGVIVLEPAGQKFVLGHLRFRSVSKNVQYIAFLWNADGECLGRLDDFITPRTEISFVGAVDGDRVVCATRNGVVLLTTVP